MRVLLTRSEEDVEKEKSLFEGEGFEVVSLPLIEDVGLDFQPPQEEFDFVIFQSQKAVKHFLSRCKLTGREKILAVGEKTKELVEKYGYKVWAMPVNYYGEELVKLLTGNAGKVLIPRSSIGREEVIQRLIDIGFKVLPLDVYQTRLLDYPVEEFEGKVRTSDFLVFASPSAVRAFFANLQKLSDEQILKGKKVVCIGKTTKEEWEKLFDISCEIPEKPTMREVLNTIKKLASFLQ